MKTVLNDLAFLACGATPPASPFSITSYADILYGAFDSVRNLTLIERLIRVSFLSMQRFALIGKINTIDDCTLRNMIRSYQKEYRKNAFGILCDQSKKRGFIHRDDRVLQMILGPSLEKYPDKKYS